MVRSTMRRAAALAGTATLAVLATAGPALAADTPTPQTQAALAASGPAAPAPAGQAQQATSQDPAAPTPADGKTYVVWCHHHHGLVSDLLEGVGDLLGALL